MAAQRTAAATGQTVAEPEPEGTALLHAQRYRIITSRDPRFDGQFYTAVRSTGIYCRPSCPARTPAPAQVTFFETAAAAHDAGFRACRRCLPEAVPGSPRWSHGADVASRAMRLISDGMVERDGVAGLARRLGYSTRQLNRLLVTELGVGPLAIARAHRAQSARALLVGTDLPITEIAFGSGFASVRQFNDTVSAVFAMTPSELRARRRSTDGPNRASGISLRLPMRPPADIAGVMAWLRHRALPGVEFVDGSTYARSVALPGGPAAFSVRQDSPSTVALAVSMTALADLPALVARVRRLFDLDADPVAIDAVLGADPLLAASVAATPGIRLPGAVDPAEMAIRAVVGQQISVAAARTQLTRLVVAAGEPVDITVDGFAFDRLFPAPGAIAAAAPSVMVGPRARAATVEAVAAALADGSLPLGVGDSPDEQYARLTAMRGVGPWTAGYVAMRVLGASDVILPTDSAMRAGARALGIPDDQRGMLAWSAQHSPWRSYASLHLWRTAASTTINRSRP